jgi:hypothetical protein
MHWKNLYLLYAIGIISHVWSMATYDQLALRKTFVQLAIYAQASQTKLLFL